MLVLSILKFLDGPAYQRRIVMFYWLGYRRDIYIDITSTFYPYHAKLFISKKTLLDCWNYNGKMFDYTYVKDLLPNYYI